MVPKKYIGFILMSLLWDIGGSIELASVFYPLLHLSLLPDPFCPRPPSFPSTIEIFQQTYHNWAEDVRVENLWTATPNTPEEILLISNWAAGQGYSVRASGYMHGWSLLTVSNTDSCLKTKVVIVKTTKLTGMEMIENGIVRVQTGASMENLMTFLETKGYGLNASPAPGDISVGGVIAINGHGTGIPADDESLPTGFTYGSISNLVLEFTAVVWDEALSKFVLRTFDRSEPDAKAFLTNLGRTFLTEVKLRVGANYNLRCLSRMDIPASELFAAPDSQTSNKVADYLASSGRIETILFPFTTKPWLKVWTVSPTKPSTSRAVDSPYNYPITDSVPVEVALMAREIIEGAWFLAPTFGELQYTTITAGMPIMDAGDIWGPSKNTLLYIKPTTLRVTANGYAVITARSNVQSIIHDGFETYQNLLSEYQSRGQFPVNGPLEIRVTGLDRPEDVHVTGAEAPSLSALRPVEGRPDLDTAIWFDILSFPGTPHLNSFMRDLESYFMESVNDGVTAVVRPEWSKGWAYTEQTPYANMTVIKEMIPEAFQTTAEGNFAWSAETLNKYDPRRVFSNDLLNVLLG